MKLWQVLLGMALWYGVQLGIILLVIYLTIQMLKGCGVLG